MKRIAGRMYEHVVRIVFALFLMAAGYASMGHMTMESSALAVMASAAIFALGGAILLAYVLVITLAIQDSRAKAAAKSLEEMEKRTIDLVRSNWTLL